MRTMDVLRVQINSNEVPWDNRCNPCKAYFYYVRGSGVFPALSFVGEDKFDVFMPSNAEKLIIEHGLNKKEVSKDEIIKRGEEMKAIIFDVDELPTTDAVFLYIIKNVIFKAWFTFTFMNAIAIVPAIADKVLMVGYDRKILKEVKL